MTYNPSLRCVITQSSPSPLLTKLTDLYLPHCPNAFHLLDVIFAPLWPTDRGASTERSS